MPSPLVLNVYKQKTPLIGGAWSNNVYKSHFCTTKTGQEIKLAIPSSTESIKLDLN